MSSQLDRLALVMITMRNDRLRQEYPEPARHQTVTRARKFNVRVPVGDAMIAAGRRLKGVKRVRASIM